MSETLINEIVGVSGSILVAISMMFRTTTDSGVLKLRIFNLLGSIVFVAYGILIPAYSTVALNVLCTILNIIGIVTIVRKIKNSKK